MGIFGIDEEILFKTDNSNDSVEELEVSSPETEVGEEVLFSNDLTEDLEFQEPTFATQTASGVEEINDIPVSDDDKDIFEEALFATATEEENKEFSVVEENLDFVEPTITEQINEEVLFNPQAEEVSLDYEGDSAVPEEINGISEIEEVQLFDDKPAYIERNFARKMLDSDPVIIARYEELKALLLTYKKVKSRVSNDFDSFNMGRIQLAKLGVSQKSLKLYLNLEYDKVETRLKCKFAGDKKAYASVPVFLRIKSDRAMRNAKYLIGKLAERFELVQSLKPVSVNAVEVLESKAKSYE